MRILELAQPHMQGTDIGAWQRFLAMRKLYTITIDGDFGEATRHATIAYQKQAQLTADGVAGAVTVEHARQDGFVPPDEEQHIDEDEGVVMFQQTAFRDAVAKTHVQLIIEDDHWHLQF